VTVAAAAEPASAQPAKPATKQDEFFFNKSEPESRGWFDHTDRNLFDGQDLDVPTYLRKGIKLAL
jgi:cell division protein FtsZ